MELTYRDKGALIETLWHAVDGVSGTLANVPGLVKRVIKTEAWRKREHRGKTYEHATFADFITSKPPPGCGWPLTKVEALLRDEPETLALFRQATVGRRGRPAKEKNDNIIVKSTQGTSRAYTLDRLQRERPDLFAKVKAGKISANAAAIEAGFRKQATPLERILKLLPKLTPTERRQLYARLDEVMKLRGVA